jgi:hypothetical protein
MPIFGEHSQITHTDEVSCELDEWRRKNAQEFCVANWQLLVFHCLNLKIDSALVGQRGVGDLTEIAPTTSLVRTRDETSP